MNAFKPVAPSLVRMLADYIEFAWAQNSPKLSTAQLDLVRDQELRLWFKLDAAFEKCGAIDDYMDYYDRALELIQVRYAERKRRMDAAKQRAEERRREQEWAAEQLALERQMELLAA